MSCADVVDRLPDWAAGRLGAAEAEATGAHLAGCASCAAEAELVRALVAARPAVPADLSSRIASIARAEVLDAPRAQDPRSVHRWRLPAWGIPAAAILVLAVGTTVIGRRVALRPQTAPVDSTLGEVAVVQTDSNLENATWISDDAVVAGAPILDELSDDNLAVLLEEMGG